MDKQGYTIFVCTTPEFNAKGSSKAAERDTPNYGPEVALFARNLPMR